MEKIALEKSIEFGIRKIQLKKVSDLVLKKFDQREEEKNGVSIGKSWYWKKVLVSFRFWVSLHTVADVWVKVQGNFVCIIHILKLQQQPSMSPSCLFVYLSLVALSKHTITHTHSQVTSGAEHESRPKQLCETTLHWQNKQE